MQTYTATFADGKTVTRKTRREYAFAYRVNWIGSDGRRVEATGFSASSELAIKAARPIAPYGIHRGMSAKDKTFCSAENAKFIANANVNTEVVPAVAA